MPGSTAPHLKLFLLCLLSQEFDARAAASAGWRIKQWQKTRPGIFLRVKKTWISLFLMSGVTNKVVRASPATLTGSERYLKCNAIRLAHLVRPPEPCQTPLPRDAREDTLADNKSGPPPDNAGFLTLLKYNLSTNDFNYLSMPLPCLCKPWNSNSSFLKPKLFARLDQALTYRQLHHVSSHRELVASAMVYLSFKIEHLTC